MDYTLHVPVSYDYRLEYISIRSTRMLFVYLYVFSCFHLCNCDRLGVPPSSSLIHHLLQRYRRETIPVLDGIADRERVAIPDLGGITN